VSLVLLGAYLIVTPFALSLFSRTRDAEHLADRYRSFASERGLLQFSTNTTEVVDGGQELLGEGFPSFAHDLGMSNAEFAAYVDAHYPAIAVYRHRAPEVFGYVTPAVRQTASQARNVSDADDFPVPGVPVTVGPWALLFGGLALMAAGVWMLAGGRQVATAVTVAVAIALVIAPLVLRWPHETAAAEEAARAARIAFTPAVARATVSDTYLTDAAVLEVNEALVPAVGRQLGLTRTEMEAKLARELPTASQFLHDWPRTLSPAGHDLSLSQIRYMDEFHDADATPYRALPWLFVVPGALVLVGLSAVSLVERRG
jgi:hypothetical protein